MTTAQRNKVIAAINLSTDSINNISELFGRVVIFKDGEVFNGGVAVLHYELTNVLLDYFEGNGFEKILVD